MNKPLLAARRLSVSSPDEGSLKQAETLVPRTPSADSKGRVRITPSNPQRSCRLNKPSTAEGAKGCHRERARRSSCHSDEVSSPTGPARGRKKPRRAQAAPTRLRIPPVREEGLCDCIASLLSCLRDAQQEFG